MKENTIIIVEQIRKTNIDSKQFKDIFKSQVRICFITENMTPMKIAMADQAAISFLDTHGVYEFIS